MPAINRKLIIDNNSLVDFFNYYYFDRDNGNKIYSDIKNFLFQKINSGEIIIIDKIFKEFTYIDFRKDLKDIKSTIKPFIVNTEHLIQEVEQLSQDHYLEYNERFLQDKSLIVAEMDKILNGADLYLIALCKEYKKDDKIYPILVSEETTRKTNYQKLIDKIPSICNKEGIECVRLPHSLFNIYKDELEFDLKIK
ncbi:MAG: DUF4411 family protein [bacterium]|nr:DUF4411 family protein [bacterium]